MTTEPTDEMVWLAVDKFLDGPSGTIGEIDGSMRDALVAVFELADRERKAAVEGEWAALEGCDEPHPKLPWHCEGVRGHEGNHQALRWYEEWP